MALIKSPRAGRAPSMYAPFQTFGELENRIRRLFDEPLGFDQLTTPIGFVPPTEIVETPDAFLLTLELPGIKAKDVDVSFENEVLTIRGEKSEEKEEKEEKEKEGWKYYMMERTYGSFTRSFTLPRIVDADRIEATFDSGVLNVRVPKLAASAQAGKKITVNEKATKAEKVETK